MKRFFNWRNKKSLIIISMFVIIFSLIGISLAYYIGAVVGNENNNINLHTVKYGEIIVKYPTTNDTLELGIINLDDSGVGTALSDFMKFEVENTGSSTEKITINWINLINTFCQYRNNVFNCTNNPSDIYVGDELTYELYSCSSENYNLATNDNIVTNCTEISKANAALPISGDTSRIQEEHYIELEAHTTNYYALKLNLINLSTNQNYHLGGVISAAINVERFTYLTLNEEILTAYPPVADNVASAYVSSATGIDFTTISSPTNGQGLYINTKANILNDPTAGTIKYFRGGTYCWLNNAAISSSAICTGAGGTWTNEHCSLSDSVSACETAGGTFYELKNNVMFGGYAWKIIRINSDGSFRMIYNGTNPKDRGSNVSTVASTYNGSSYLAGTVGTTNQNTAISFASYEGSVLKSTIEAWYSNIADYSEYLADQNFCSDTTWGTKSSNWYFLPRTRVYDNFTPSYDCTATQIYNVANGKLTAPIGTIDANDFWYSAGTNTVSYTHFLQSGAYYWTMSPSYWVSTGGIYNFSVFSTGRIGSAYVNTSYAGRPVINLKADSIVVSGNGTLDTPWIILDS